MRTTTLAAALLIAISSFGSGCASDSASRNASMTASDDCAMCPGKQHASDDGRCPECGMAVKRISDDDAPIDCCAAPDATPAI